MRNYYLYGQMITLTALLNIASLTMGWGQDNLNVYADCGTSTLTVSGYFSTNNHGMIILLFKDNAIVSVATDVAGPSVNRTFGLSGSGSYYARAMEVNNDVHNINSASISVNCSSNQPSQPSSPPPSSPSNGNGSLNFQIVSYDCNSGALQYQFTSGDGSPINVTLPGVFGGTMSPNSVASYTFPGDARTGRTITGTAAQGGNQVNISFTTSCNLTSGQQSGGSSGNTNPPSTGGNCSFSEGQFLFTFYGEQIYAHYYNGVLFAAYQDGSGFKPQHWMQAASGTAGFDQIKVPCFSEQDPRTSGGGSNNPPTYNPPASNSPSGSPQAGGNMVGNLDGADCQVLSGWIVNRNTPNRSTKFDVYINDCLAAVGVPATQSRPDVANALGISGYTAFGFVMPIPNQYKNGRVMTISVKYSGTNTDIQGSPKTTANCQHSNCGSIEIHPGSGARTDGTAFKMNFGKQVDMSVLTSKLISVRKNSFYSLDAYAHSQTTVKQNLAPQITSAVIGGVLAGITLSRQSATSVDRSPQVHPSAPVLGMSAALLAPLIKSAFKKSIPEAEAEIAFYNKRGEFIHRQITGITKSAQTDWEQLHIEGYANEDGYAIVRLQNKSKEPVWFDNVSFQQVDMPPFTEERLFIPSVTKSLNGFAMRQMVNGYTVFNCEKLDDPLEGGWINVDVTVTGFKPQWYFIGGSSDGGFNGGSNDGGGSSSSTSSVLIPGGAPQNPSVNDVYNSPSGVTYIWDGKSWCIPVKPVDVKGQRPSNPADREIYIYVDPNFGYITEYEYINGRWTMPLRDNEVGQTVDNSTLPKPLKNATKSSKPDGCKTFNAMWNRQNNDRHVEQLALITDKGIFWLTDEDNTVTSSKIGAVYEYGGNAGSKWFVKDGVVYYIKATVHTHPMGDAYGQQPSTNDKNTAKDFGAPDYIISKDGIYKVDAQGNNLGIIDYNYANLFNCDLDQNIVEELR